MWIILLLVSLLWVIGTLNLYVIVSFVFKCTRSVSCSFECISRFLTVFMILIIVKESKTFQFLFSVLKENGFCSRVIDGQIIRSLFLNKFYFSEAIFIHLHGSNQFVFLLGWDLFVVAYFSSFLRHTVIIN